MKKIYCILFSILSFSVTSAQMVVDNNAPNNSPTYLINNILLGGGVSAFNHFFQGDSSQIGFFNGVNSNLGIDSGIVLSSGNILDLVGPNASGSTTTSYNLPGDPTLDAVIFPDPTNDAAVLEFDFVPTSDTISFKYVFGSEEYLEWVNSFNDAFGFFLSGPNPAGGTYVDENLAIIPGSNTPVTIDNVNNVVNSVYYIDNGDGSTAPQNTDSTVIQFDGFTTPLTATAAVNCGDTYHIKLVVADAVDWSYDSGIFLEAGSFSSVEPGAVSIQVNTTDAICSGDSSGAASISCVQGVSPPYTINWNGQDPNALIAGTYTVTITDALGITTSTNYAIIQSNTIITTVTQIGNNLSATVIGGTPNYSYQWLFNGIVIDTNALFTLAQNGDYRVVVTDANGCIDTSTSINVNNIPSGINEFMSKELIIYPNPFTNQTTIKFLNTSDKVIEISLYDPTGRSVKNLELIHKGNSIILKKRNLSKGLYLLIIKTNNYISKSKLVIK